MLHTIYRYKRDFNLKNSTIIDDTGKLLNKIQKNVLVPVRMNTIFRAYIMYSPSFSEPVKNLSRQTVETSKLVNFPNDQKYRATAVIYAAVNRLKYDIFPIQDRNIYT